MALVDPRLLESLHQQPVTVDKTVSVLNTLDGEMESVMKRLDLTQRDKVRMYNDILEKYLTFRDKYNRQTNPIPVKVVDKKMEAKKARLIINRIKRSPIINWNKKGELVYKDQLIEGSNISDLINDSLRHIREFTPKE